MFVKYQVFNRYFTLIYQTTVVYQHLDSSLSKTVIILFNFNQ